MVVETARSVPFSRSTKTSKPGVWTLYDMEVDPSETSNLAKQHPEVLKRLRGEYEAFLKEVDAGNMQPLPIQIGHDE